MSKLISSLVLTSLISVPQAFALENLTASCKNESGVSWASRLNTSPIQGAGVLSLNTVGAEIYATNADGLEIQPALVDESGNELAIGGSNLSIVRVSAASTSCSQGFGTIGLNCDAESAIVSLKDAEGKISTVTTKAHLNWLNRDFLISLDGANASSVGLHVYDCGVLTKH